MAPLLDILVLIFVLGVLIVLRTAGVAPLDGDKLLVIPDPTGINLISTLKRIEFYNEQLTTIFKIHSCSDTTENNVV